MKNLLLLVALLVLVPCASASAGNLQYGLSFSAEDGERNRVSITAEGANLVFRDSNPIRLNDGRCSQPDPDTVVCPPSDFTPTIRLGDGDDSFDMRAPGSTSLDGGPGDDVLTGGPGEDGLGGGPGADRMVGGDGDDSLSHGDDADPDLLDGGNGADSLTSGAGDTANGGDGVDFFFAGEGTHLRARDGNRDHLDCRGDLGSVELDIVQGQGFPDGQDLLARCKRGALGRLKLVTRARRFKIGPRTRTIPLTVSCPASTLVMCESGLAGVVLGIGKPCFCAYSSGPLRVLPGGTLRVRARIPRSEFQDLRSEVRSRREVRAGLSWVSDMGPDPEKLDRLWVQLVWAGRR